MEKSRTAFKGLHPAAKILLSWLIGALLVSAPIKISAEEPQAFLLTPPQIAESITAYFASPDCMLPPEKAPRKLAVVADPFDCVASGNETCIFSYAGIVVIQESSGEKAQKSQLSLPFETYVRTGPDGKREIFSAPMLPPLDHPDYPRFVTAGTEWDAPLKTVLTAKLGPQQAQEAVAFLNRNQAALQTALETAAEYKAFHQESLDQRLEGEEKLNFVIQQAVD